jgi:hypothetical protein
MIQTARYIKKKLVDEDSVWHEEMIGEDSVWHEEMIGEDLH